MDSKSSCRWPVDEHVVVKVAEQYPSAINDTGMIGEELNISYTVTWDDLIRACSRGRCW